LPALDLAAAQLRGAVKVLLDPPRQVGRVSTGCGGGVAAPGTIRWSGGSPRVLVGAVISRLQQRMRGPAKPGRHVSGRLRPADYLTRRGIRCRQPRAEEHGDMAVAREMLSNKLESR